MTYGCSPGGFDGGRLGFERRSLKFSFSGRPHPPTMLFLVFLDNVPLFFQKFEFIARWLVRMPYSYNR